MVEFGLKLEDNKVAEWSQSYIDYEKLKGILKKAKIAGKKRDDLIKRRPDLAAAILAAYGSGETKALFTPSSSTLDKEETDATKKEITELATPRARNGHGKISPLSVPLFETQEILTKRTVTPETFQYGSVPLKGVTSYGSHSSLGDSSLSGLFKGVTEYFSKSKYEEQLRDAFSFIDSQHTHFGAMLESEFQKVNGFYDSKMKELDEGLHILEDSVHSSDTFERNPPTPRSAGTIVNFIASTIKRKRKTSDGGVHSQLLVDEDMSDDEIEKNAEDGSKMEDKVRESDSIQRALIDQYRRVKLLQNFTIINYTGFVKIVKKSDKSFPNKKGAFKDLTESSNICNEGNKATEALINKMEKMYAGWFCGGNLREAQAQMLPKRGDGLQMDWSQLRLGYRLGMCSILAMWVCWDCIWGLFRDGNTTIGGRSAFPVFRGCGGLLLLHWCWGFSVYIWSRYRINYIFLFDFNPKLVDSAMKIFNDTVDETLVFLSTMLLYYKSGAHDIPELVPSGVYAAVLVLYTVKNLLFPWKTRSQMWRAVWGVVSSPVESPTFFTVYVADVLTSMVKVFQDIAWTLAFLCSGDFLLSEEDEERFQWHDEVWYKNVLIPLLCLLPLWFRINQCLRKYMDTGERFPNLANAFKYGMSQTVTLFGAFHPLYQMAGGQAKLFQFFWMALFLASSLYSFVWDVYMDWGLGRLDYALLGPRLMFPNRYHYYGVIAADLVLRSMWVLSLIPPQSGAQFEIPAYLTAVAMALELLRRTLWGFFRLENEHRQNTEHFRRVSFVPLHFSTGHAHKYTQEKEHVGRRVLAEVAAVSLLVIFVSVSSVIAAQRATIRFTPEL